MQFAGTVSLLPTQGHVVAGDQKPNETMADFSFPLIPKRRDNQKRMKLKNERGKSRLSDISSKQTVKSDAAC